MLTKSFISVATEFLDLSLTIEKIDLSLCCNFCCVNVKEMVKKLYVTLARGLSIQVFSCVKTVEKEGERVNL